MATTTTPTETSTDNPGLHIALWAVQGVLALAFIAAGFMKTFLPMEELLANMAWVEMVGPVVRFIGLCELLGGIGLIVPAATRIKPILTPLAAVALIVVMVLAAGLHAVRGEFSAIGINFALGGLAAFVAWGRFKMATIAPRED